jgi:large subunit ribosomal protein L29
MKYSDIKSLSANELNKKGKTSVKDLFEMKMKNSLGQLANPMEIRDLRKNIARIKTAISQQAKG